MAELTSALVTPIADTKILDLAYKISKFINLAKAEEEIYQAGQLVKLSRALNNTASLLEYTEKQQIIQGLIGIGKLKI